MSTTLGGWSASRPELWAMTVQRVPTQRWKEKLAMAAHGIVVQPGQGSVSSFTPGAADRPQAAGWGDRRHHHFEEKAPNGKRSYLHLHHDSDEVAYVLSGEVTFKIG